MSKNIVGPAQKVFASAQSSGAVAVSDSTVYDFQALWIGVAGTVSIDHTEGSAASVFTNVPAGFFQVSGVRVNAATTATGILWVRW